MTFTRADTVNIAILLFLSCIWGTAFAAIKIAVIDIGPFGVAAARSLIVCVSCANWLSCLACE